MEYENLERDFVTRTLKIICQYEQYKKNIPPTEQFEVTLLINCLVGLLILPRELCYNNIPDTPIDQLKDWGLCANHIIKPGRNKRNPGKNEDGPELKKTLKDVVRSMRNSVAHFRLKVCGNGSEITCLEFSDKSGFKSVIPVECLKIFVTKLAQSVCKNE